MRFLGLVVSCVLVLSVTLADSADAQQPPEVWLVSVVASNGRIYGATFVDVATIERRATNVRAWQETRIAADAPADFSETTRIMTLSEFDCVGRRSHILQATSYFRAPNRGPFTSGEGGWTYATPGSAGEAALNFVCGTPTERLGNGDYTRLGPGLDTTEAASMVFNRR